VIYGGEHVARTPIEDSSQSLWLAEKSSDNVWKWINPKQEEEGNDTCIMPPWRVAHSQAAVGDVVYMFGGRTGVDMSETAMNDMWKLQLSDGGEGGTPKAVWTEIKQEGNIPEARSFHKMIAIGSDLYLFGGVGGNGRLNDLWKFDTTTDKWTSLGNSVLRGRGGPNILSLSNTNESDDVKIAIVAGFAGEETNDGHIYSNNKWEENEMTGLENLRKRSVCAFGSLKGFGFLFGGEVAESTRGHEGAGGFANDLVILDKESGALIETIEQPKDEKEWPEPRGWGDATTDGDDTFYTFGGLTGDDTAPKRLEDLWMGKISK